MKLPFITTLLLATFFFTGELCAQRKPAANRPKGGSSQRSPEIGQTAVVIDLRRNRALWEDFMDVAIARGRTGEPKESLTAVRRRLARAGRLKRSA